MRLAYETWGTLAEDGSNAVLVLHALTGDSHVTGEAGPGHPTAGWWQSMVVFMVSALRVKSTGNCAPPKKTAPHGCRFRAAARGRRGAGREPALDQTALAACISAICDLL